MSRLAINGGTPVRSGPFPSWPVHDRRELEMMEEVVSSGKWGRYEGSMVERFEKEFARYHDARQALAVLNGTIALEVALRALGVGAGDEVIVPPYTFVATATAPLMANAVPVFVDVDPATWNIDPEKIEAAITGRTRAIIPVHFAGLPADMDRIQEIARRHGLFVLEDCAHAHGATWQGRKVGALGDMGAFSFQSSKNLSCGEGGAVTSND
ncbi:MAG: DegT/DnrJ/EryC1/StrS family aminotransferase, partial [Bacteroidota bacterium]